MATLARLLDCAQPQSVAFDQGICDRNLSVITKLTHGFATQDIDLIMSHFSEDASYFDIMGHGQHGAEAKGKPAIRKAFLQQFAVTGTKLVDADVKQGWQVDFVLHNHAFHLSDPALNGILAPSVPDANFNSNFLQSHGLGRALITNGIDTVEIPSMAFDDFQRD